MSQPGKSNRTKEIGAGRHIGRQDTGHHKPDQSRSQAVQAGVAEGFFRIVERGPQLQHQCGHDQAGERPTDGAEPLDHRTVGHAHPSAALRPAGGAHAQHVRLGGNAHQAVQGQHGDHEAVDAAVLVVEIEEVGGQAGPHARKAAHRRQARRNDHERECDNEKSLDQVGVGRGHEAAKEAVADKRRRHDQDDPVGRDDLPAGGHRNDLARPLEHGSLVEHEKGDGDQGINR